MQAPYYCTPYADPTMTQDQYSGSFARGSSFVYPHEDYSYMTDASASVCVSGAFDAAGLAFPSEYTDIQGWQWETTAANPHGFAAPPLPPPPPALPSLLPQLPPASGSSLLDLPSTIKSALAPTQNLPSPTAQLPTPAAMAVLLNPNAHTRRAMQQQQQQQQQPPVIMPDATTTLIPDILSREKKHACTMCHKRFDRPSTLRKHLLVHTGEKAFVCETCGRRFGVASNLNRHVRRCILKPVNAVVSAVGAGGTSSSTSPPAVAGGTSSDLSSDHDSSGIKAISSPKRGRALSSTGSTSSSSSSSCNPPPTQKGGADGTVGQKPAGQKRRRRAPSPSLWVPWSLRAFNLTCEEFYRSSPVPLPPVRRSLPKEERDSWDENAPSRPYHPVEWRGVLPGPGLGHGLGLGGKDVRNINFGASGGIMLGRVLVF